MTASSKLQMLMNHPAGPKTIHLWAPTFKWAVTIANLVDMSKPPEHLSYPQQTALACSGIIWARHSAVKNWDQFSVSVGMAATSMYQLARMIQHDFFPKYEEVVEAAKIV